MAAPVIWNGTSARFLTNAIAIPGSTSGTLTMQPAASTTSYTLTWPSAQGGANTVLQNDGSGGLSWASAASGGISKYYQGYMPAATVWTSGSTGSFATLGISSGTNTLTTRVSSGITVTAAGSNAPGITFTPSSNTAVYLVSARFTSYNQTASQANAFRLYDGTNIIGVASQQSSTNAANAIMPVYIQGIYAPATTSAVTINLQCQVNGGTANVNDPAAINPALEWQIIQLIA